MYTHTEREREIKENVINYLDKHNTHILIIFVNKEILNDGELDADLIFFFSTKKKI